MMVAIPRTHVDTLKMLNDNQLLSDSELLKFLETGFKCICSPHNATETVCLPNKTSPDSNLQLKRLEVSILYIISEYARHGETAEEFLDFLINECSIDLERATVFREQYEKWYQLLRHQLSKIGSHLPHITDVKWKLDHIVKTHSLNQSDGPLFRISLKTNSYNEACQDVRLEHVEFTCNTQELQDLVYKLKEAVNHCHKIASSNNLH